MKVGQVRLWKNPWGPHWCIYVIIKRCSPRWVWRAMILASDGKTDVMWAPGTLFDWEDTDSIVENSSPLLAEDA